MQLKLLAAAIVAAATLSACVTRPVVVQTPAPEPERVYVPVEVPVPAPVSLHDRVHAALQDGMGSAASGIEVRVDGSKVYLTGTVATKADHDRAHSIAHDVSGVSSVDHSGLKVY